MRHRFEYAIVRAVMAMVRLMPNRMVLACGTLLGDAFYLFDRPHRRTAERNLAFAFPRRSESERRAIARAAFGHFGRALFDLLKFSTLSNEEMLARVVEFEGDDRVRAAYAQGKGVFMLTFHFGFWEVHGLLHALQYEPIGVLVRPLDNPYLDGLVEQIRQRTGNTAISRKGAIRRVLRMLHEGHGVAVLIDQHVHGPDAVHVDFFGRPAATTSAIAAMALRTGAKVVPCYVLPAGGGRYRAVYEHPVEPPAADSPDAIQEFTQRCTDVLEMLVRRRPELWLWMHRRWRDGGEPVAGMFPSEDRATEEEGTDA